MEIILIELIDVDSEFIDPRFNTIIICTFCVKSISNKIVSDWIVSKYLLFIEIFLKKDIQLVLYMFR